MQKNRYSATGSRKEAVAKVRIHEGKGKIIVNGQFMQEYFHRPGLETIVVKPFKVTDILGKMDVIAKVIGGGKSGQASALMLGIARALLKRRAICWTASTWNKPDMTSGLIVTDMGLAFGIVGWKN